MTQADGDTPLWEVDWDDEDAAKDFLQEILAELAA